MQREIKFRAWDKYTKEMSYDVLYDKENEGGVRPWIYMQYTGLKDKDGKEIYEGDIIKHGYEDEIGVIEWSEYCYVMDGRYLTVFNQYLFEVIGNIYENKSLLIDQSKGGK